MDWGAAISTGTFVFGVLVGVFGGGMRVGSIKTTVDNLPCIKDPEYNSKKHDMNNTLIRVDSLTDRLKAQVDKIEQAGLAEQVASLTTSIKYINSAIENGIWREDS